MQIEEYQLQCVRTMNNELDYGQKVDNMVYGMIGELGEVVDLLKKAKYQGHEISRTKLAYEIGDLLWYVVNLATLHELDIRLILQMNHSKLLMRYPIEFDADLSRNRGE